MGVLPHAVLALASLYPLNKTLNYDTTDNCNATFGETDFDCTIRNRTVQCYGQAYSKPVKPRRNVTPAQLDSQKARVKTLDRAYDCLLKAVAQKQKLLDERKSNTAGSSIQASGNTFSSMMCPKMAFVPLPSKNPLFGGDAALDEEDWQYDGTMLHQTPHSVGYWRARKRPHTRRCTVTRSKRVHVRRNLLQNTTLGRSYVTPPEQNMFNSNFRPASAMPSSLSMSPNNSFHNLDAASLVSSGRASPSNLFLQDTEAVGNRDAHQETLSNSATLPIGEKVSNADKPPKVPLRLKRRSNRFEECTLAIVRPVKIITPQRKKLSFTKKIANAYHKVSRYVGDKLKSKMRAKVPYSKLREDITLDQNNIITGKLIVRFQPVKTKRTRSVTKSIGVDTSDLSSTATKGSQTTGTSAVSKRTMEVQTDAEPQLYFSEKSHVLPEKKKSSPALRSYTTTHSIFVNPSDHDDFSRRNISTAKTVTTYPPPTPPTKDSAAQLNASEIPLIPTPPPLPPKLAIKPIPNPLRLKRNALTSSNAEIQDMDLTDSFIFQKLAHEPNADTTLQETPSQLTQTAAVTNLPQQQKKKVRFLDEIQAFNSLYPGFATPTRARPRNLKMKIELVVPSAEKPQIINDWLPTPFEGAAHNNKYYLQTPHSGPITQNDSTHPSFVIKNLQRQHPKALTSLRFVSRNSNHSEVLVFPLQINAKTHQPYEQWRSNHFQPNAPSVANLDVNVVQKLHDKPSGIYMLLGTELITAERLAKWQQIPPVGIQPRDITVAIKYGTSIFKVLNIESM